MNIPDLSELINEDSDEEEEENWYSRI
jgi:hypothetical protein